MILEDGLLDRLCPMHLAVEADGRIRHIGPTASKVIGEVAGERLFDVLRIDRPRGIDAMPALLERAGRKLHLEGGRRRAVSLVGHVVPTAGGGAVLDLGFGIGVAEAVRRHGLTGSDFPPTDLTMEILFLIEAQSAAMNASRTLNKRLHSARIAAEAEAATDTLTGLGNRRAADITLSALSTQDAPFGLVHLDLDNFKTVNDTLGHAPGDQVLCDVARALQGAIRPGDIAARIGGDEFVLIFPDLSEEARLIPLCTRLIRNIERVQPGSVAGPRVSASAGIAIWPGGAGMDPGALLEQADRALYASKRDGRARVSVAEPVAGLPARRVENQAGFLPGGS